jgi:hypothetical protein
MSSGFTLTTQTILESFSEEIESRSGRVLDVCNDGRRLFVRSLLPGIEEVRPADSMQGGVALRGSESEVWVHPYLFRQVCRNGAIMAHTLQSAHVERLDEMPVEDAAASVREAVAACCAEEVFTNTMNQVRSATEMQADLALSLVPILARFHGAHQGNMLTMILNQFTAGGDATGFGLMNAVTAVARDTRDPEVRWRLEELGGGIPALLSPARDDSGSRVQRTAALLVP